MELYDVALIADADMKVIQIVWGSERARNRYGPTLSLLYGRCITEYITEDQGESGALAFPFDQVMFQRLYFKDEVIFLLRWGGEVQELLEYALELSTEGVQVYDRNGYLLYLNEMSQKLSALPPKDQLLGKHLLDIWNLPEDVSTTLSSLRERRPIQNRIDTFLDANKGYITTVNSAYPLIRGKQLIGTVLLEQDEGGIRRQKQEIQEREEGLRQYSQKRKQNTTTGYNFDCIIGDSEGMQNAVRLARRFARENCNMMLIGETGTGKEIFAQSIHKSSTRSDKPFVAVNCAAVPETLIESMLFGTQRGAFTGSENKAGLFEEANGGTLFLDEVNSMSLSMQSKILRVVQEGLFRRIGSNKDFHTDVRIISSSNEDPFVLVEDNSMRKDLFYRLSTVQIRIPPLRERKEDIPALVRYYLGLKKGTFAKRIDYIAPQVMELFAAYSWPGNVRELFHVLDYAFSFTDGGVISVETLPEYLVETPRPTSEATQEIIQYTQCQMVESSLEEIMGEYESQVLRIVLEHYGNNISRAAKSLGISRQSLSYRIKKYGFFI